MRILGLDVSTTTIGMCVLETDDMSILELTYFSPSKKDDIFKKAEKAFEKINLILRKHAVSKVYIEESVQRFTPGMSSAATIITLANFNFLISYFTQRSVHLENLFWVKPTEARKSCGLVVTTKKKAGGASQKQQVYDQITSPTGLLRNVPFAKNKNGNPKPCNYDMVDSYVVAYHGAKKEKSKI